MTAARPRAILFASAPAWIAAAALRHARARFPDHDWVVCGKPRERLPLPAEVGVEPLPPLAATLAFRAELRRRGFAVAIACRSPYGHYGRLAFLHATCGAATRLTFDGDGREVAPASLAALAAAAAGRAVLQLYAGTLGALLGALLTFAKHLRCRLGLGPRARWPRPTAAPPPDRAP